MHGHDSSEPAASATRAGGVPEAPGDTTEFDRDTALEPHGEGVWRGTVTDRWGIIAGPNGGYLASFPIRAMLAQAPFPAPLSMTTHFHQRPVHGPVEVRVSTNHVGRGHAFLGATMVQEHGAVATAVAVFGRRRDGDPEVVQAAAPEYPRPQECRHGRASVIDMTFLHRFEYRLAEPMEAVGGPAVVEGWIRLVDRALDDLAVPLFMDAFMPPMFRTLGPGMAPTIELTVHWRSRPRTGWHFGRFVSRFLVGGYVEEDGELWGEDGRLVAQSRQISRFTPGPPPS